MADDFKKTGLQCLELLFSRFRPGVNFAARVTDSLIEKLDKDELDAIFFLADGQELRPEKESIAVYPPIVFSWDQKKVFHCLPGGIPELSHPFETGKVLFALPSDNSR